MEWGNLSGEQGKRRLRRLRGGNTKRMETQRSRHGADAKQSGVRDGAEAPSRGTGLLVCYRTLGESRSERIYISSPPFSLTLRILRWYLKCVNETHVHTFSTVCKQTTSCFGVYNSVFCSKTIICDSVKQIVGKWPC